MAIDGASLIMSVAVSGFLVWSALANLRTGEVGTLAGHVRRRAGNPSMCWFAAVPSLVMAAIFAALAVAALWKMAGWWELTL